MSAGWLGAMQQPQTFLDSSARRETRAYTSLRELVMHYAKRRGWRTQRRIATACELEETALSRFLHGEQDLGARRTHALFRAVGIPVDDYNLAYELLARVQEQARQHRESRLDRLSAPELTKVEHDGHSGEVAGIGRRDVQGVGAVTTGLGVRVRYLLPDGDLPTPEVLALFRSEHYASEQIAAFFGG